MIGTVLALIIAILLHFSDIGKEVLPNFTILGIILIAVATLFLLLPVLAITYAWVPLQRAEQDLTPRVFELFRKDMHIRIANIILLIFPLISYALAIDIIFLNALNKNITFPIWIILLGISMDALHHLLKRLSGYLDPFFVTDMLEQDGKKNIQDGQELDLCYDIDALSEIGIRAIQRTSMSLCNHSVNALQKTAKVFFESAKSIGNISLEEKGKSLGLSDTVSYTLFYLLQRFETINDKAIEKKLEPVCSNIITALGKVSIAAAKCDITLASYPLHFLGRLAISAQKQGLQEVGPKAILTLQEVGKNILTEIDVKYAELQEPFFTLIAQLHDITNEMFRQDKNINIKLLTQPFVDLKILFSTEKMASHQDTPSILHEITRVLDEYNALAEVMRSMPSIPPMAPEGEFEK